VHARPPALRGRHGGTAARQAESVSVELATPLPARGAGAVAQALLKHLLFIRQQLPMRSAAGRAGRASRARRQRVLQMSVVSAARRPPASAREVLRSRPSRRACRT
jgi:hypothetical protein